MPRLPAAPAALVALVLVLATACASGAATPAPTTIETPEDAAALVIASDPRFAGIGPRDPDVIGACCFWEARVANGGFEVDVEIGWGDCPAGCINRHTWSFTVGPTGAIELIGEAGPPVPAGVTGGGEGGNGGGGILPGGAGIIGRAVAGPTCPVVRPDDPACDDRPVAGATILVLDERGTEVARLITADDGTFHVTLPPGTYTVEPQPVEGLLGTPGTMEVIVGRGFSPIDVGYDTGIR
jgi:Prealbumin-like fold domain